MAEKIDNKIVKGAQVIDAIINESFLLTAKQVHYLSIIPALVFNVMGLITLRALLQILSGQPIIIIPIAIMGTLLIYTDYSLIMETIEWEKKQ